MPRVEIGYNTKTKSFGTLVGVAPPYVIRFRNMSRRQRRIALAAAVPLKPELLAYLRKRETEKAAAFWSYCEIAVKDGVFNPMVLSKLRDDAEEERVAGGSSHAEELLRVLS